MATYKEKVIKRIDEVLREQDIYADWVLEDTYEGEGAIAFHISWGDWKHDHLCADLAIERTFSNCSIATVTTEQDGSDCYSATHYVTGLI